MKTICNSIKIFPYQLEDFVNILLSNGYIIEIEHLGEKIGITIFKKIDIDEVLKEENNK